MRNAFRIVIREPEYKRLLAGLRYDWGVILKWVFKSIVFENGN
jgi:hypothetical protein